MRLWQPLFHSVFLCNSGCLRLVVYSGAELANALARRTSIPVKQQILLCGPPFTRLDPRRSLVATVRVDCDVRRPSMFLTPCVAQAGKKIFLFSRVFLGRGAPAPPELEVTPQELERTHACVWARAHAMVHGDHAHPPAPFCVLQSPAHPRPLLSSKTQ